MKQVSAYVLLALLLPLCVHADELPLSGTWRGICEDSLNKILPISYGTIDPSSNRVDLTFDGLTLKVHQELYWDHDCRVLLREDDLSAPFHVKGTPNPLQSLVVTDEFPTVETTYMHEKIAGHTHVVFLVTGSTNGILISEFSTDSSWPHYPPKNPMYRPADYDALLARQAAEDAKYPNAVTQAPGLYETTGYIRDGKKTKTVVRLIVSPKYLGMTPLGHPTTQQEIYLQPVITDGVPESNIAPTRAYLCNPGDSRCDSGIINLYQNSNDGTHSYDPDSFTISNYGLAVYHRVR